MSYRIGTRKSDLALVQARYVQSLLESQNIKCELVTIESHGDKNLSQPLYEIETSGPGLFTKHLENALLRNEVDLAVHSLKDLPTQQPPELFVAAIPAREIVNDVLLKRAKELPRGATVGTSSLRREAMLLSERDDLKILPIRGNVPTRVRAVVEGKIDGVVLAAAGLKRLGLDLSKLHVEELSVDRFVPAPAQGALGIEMRSQGDLELRAALARLNDPVAALETSIERKILRELEGGCTLPLGVLCRSDGKVHHVKAFLGVLDPQGGARKWEGFHRFDISDASPETCISKSVSYFRPYLKKKVVS